MNTNDKEFLVQKIRSQYTEKQTSELDELKALDKRVKKPANIFTYTFGVIASLIMGSGMSLVMTELPEKLGMGDMMIPGIIIGVIGMIMAIVNYPIYKTILASRRKKYAQKIINLSNNIMRG